MTDLTDTEKTLLRIESRLWIYPGAKAQAIRDETGLSDTQAAQVLNRIIDTEAALAHDALTVRRIRRLRAARKRSRPVQG